MRPESALSDDVLHQALDAAPDGIAVVDEAGAIVFVNPMVEQLFEYSRNELLGTSIDLLLPERARHRHAAHRAEYAARPRTRSMGTGLDLSGRRRSGTEFPVEISLSPLHTGDGLLRVVVVIRDITKRKIADEVLERASGELALADDRERIARDLHDTVIQRLFAVGLSLQGALARAAGDPAIERIQLAVDEIDVTIREIRSSIFALHTRRYFDENLRDDVLTIAREATRVLGFAPAVTFDGPLETVVTDEMRDHLLATLREALSNITKHARASSVGIDLVVEGHRVCLRVCDDGVGVNGTGAGRGLHNMSERAVELAGDFEIAPAPTGGTRLEWRVPIRRDPGEPGTSD